MGIMKIILDAMGGDFAPREVVKGALLAIDQLNVEIILVGKGEQILRVLQDEGKTDLPKGLEISNAEDVVGMEDDPLNVAKERKDSSMVVALNMLAEGKGDALVSAGSTGALITAATLIVKRIKGIRRAALGVEFPTVADANSLIIDCGANAECTPEYLLQFAYMGSHYMRSAHNINAPRVGLLNIGTEEGKGTALQREAFGLLKKAGDEGRINFIGNIEARDVAQAVADVVVADGFSGNILLKTAEGVAAFILDELKAAFSKSIGTKLAYLLVKSGMKDLKKKMDYREVGGTPLLGISKPVIKAHGSSNAKAIFGAIRQAMDFAGSGIISDITDSIEYMKQDSKMGNEDGA